MKLRPCANAAADRYATEGNFLVVMPDIIDKGDVRCPSDCHLVACCAAPL